MLTSLARRNYYASNYTGKEDNMADKVETRKQEAAETIPEWKNLGNEDKAYIAGFIAGATRKEEKENETEDE